MATKMGFRADGDQNSYVYLEADNGSAIIGVDAGDDNRLKISASTSVGLQPSSASPMIVLDPRTTNVAGAGDIVFLPKGMDGSGNVSIDSGTLIVLSMGTGVVQSDSGGTLSSSTGSDGQLLIGATSAAPAWASLTSSGSTITITPGANTINLEVAGGGGGSVSTITGNTGGALSPTAGNIDIVTANSTAVFAGSGSTETLDFAATSNVVLGSSLPSISGATYNAGLGTAALAALTSGNYNTAVGYHAFTALTANSSNTGLGYNVGASIVTGQRNLFLGANTGDGYTTGSESDNISIGTYNTYETPGNSHTLIIGAGTGIGDYELANAYICGIQGVNVGSVASVVSISGDQLGSTTITAGSGISVTPGANTITIAASGGSFSWVDVTSGTQAIAVNTGYISDYATMITYTLPATAAQGTTFSIVGGASGASGGSWSIAQNSGQNIEFGNVSTTVGTGGSLTSTNQYDSIQLVCIVADTTWTTIGGPQGNITVV